MPDVRDVVARLAPEDRAVWQEHRTCMRKCYLSAVAATVTIDGFVHEDDSFLDLIDIRLALLFDRAGWLPNAESVKAIDEAKYIEGDIIKAEDKIKNGNVNLNKIDAASGWKGAEK
jgi:hypothetical protein